MSEEKKEEKREPDFIEQTKRVLDLINTYHWGWFGRENIPYSIIFGAFGVCVATAGIAAIVASRDSNARLALLEQTVAAHSQILQRQ